MGVIIALSTEKFLKRNVPLRHLLNKTPFSTSWWWRSAFKDVGNSLSSKSLIRVNSFNKCCNFTNLINILLNFSGETYDESEALGEPLAEATQNDPTILPAYGAPAEYAPAKKY